MDAQLPRQRLHQFAPLVAGVVQDHRGGRPQPRRRQGPQQRANRVRRDVPVVAHPDHLVRHRVQRAQHAVALPPAGRTHEQARQAPEATQERGPDEVRRIDEVHGATPGASLAQTRLQVLAEEAALLLGVFPDGLPGRHRDGRHLAVAQPQVGLEEGADLGQAAAHPRLLEDDPGGLLGAARRVVPEILFDGAFVLQQHRLGASPLAATHLLQAALEILVEVALRRAQGDSREGGDLLVRQAVTLQPQHFHLALDVRMRVFIAIGADCFEVVVRESKLAHRRCPWCRCILLPNCRLGRLMPPGQTCHFSPRRVYIQMPVPETLPGLEWWKGMRSIGMATLVCVRDGKETADTRYYISSLPVGVKQFAHAVRSHWGIENSCHWSLDMTYREDESRMRDAQLRENFAWLNRFTLSLLKQHPGKDSIVMKRRGCGWNENYLLEVLMGIAT